MELSDIIKKSKLVKKTADEVLETTGLVSLLSDYGHVEIIGSYKYDLMYAPDIDLVITTDDPDNTSLKALTKLIEQRQFQKYEYGDFVKFPRAKRPKGYILVLSKEIDGVKWEIEIWFLSQREESFNEIDSLMQNITLGQRNTILRLKQEKEELGIDKKKISSADIYKAVLTKNAQSIAEV